MFLLKPRQRVNRSLSSELLCISLNYSGMLPSDWWYSQAIYPWKAITMQYEATSRNFMWGQAGHQFVCVCVPPDVVPSMKFAFLFSWHLFPRCFCYNFVYSSEWFVFHRSKIPVLSSSYHRTRTHPWTGGGISIPRPWRKSEAMHAPGRRDEVCC